MSAKYNIPFLRVNMGEEEKQALSEVVDSGWLVLGPKTEELEKRFAEYVGAKHAVFVSSASLALFLAPQALGKKGEVFKVPSFTFTATAAEMIHAGNSVEFVDVDLDTLSVGGKFEGNLVKVHYGGNYSKATADTVIEDSAHVMKRDQCRGNPNIVCFSFAYSKNVSGGDGGMICTNDQAVYEWLIKARQFGRKKIDPLKDTEHPGWTYEIEFFGWKGNATEFQAAVALAQFKKLDSLNAKRDEIVRIYNQAFERSWSGNHLYPICVSNRQEFMTRMQEEGVQCSLHYVPLHWMKAYKDILGRELPNTEWLGKHLVTLPLYPNLSDDEINHIVSSAQKFGQFVSAEK